MDNPMVGKALQKLDEMEDKLMKSHPVFSKVKGQLQGFGMPPEVKMVYLAAVVGVLFSLILLITSGVRALSNVVATWYPVWQSLKALGSKGKDDDSAWLAYWIFYSTVQTMESVTDVFLFWIPMYEWLKMGIYVFMWHPKTQGA